MLLSSFRRLSAFLLLLLVLSNPATPQLTLPYESIGTSEDPTVLQTLVPSQRCSLSALLASESGLPVPSCTSLPSSTVLESEGTSPRPPTTSQGPPATSAAGASTSPTAVPTSQTSEDTTRTERSSQSGSTGSLPVATAPPSSDEPNGAILQSRVHLGATLLFASTLLLALLLSITPF